MYGSWHNGYFRKMKIKSAGLLLAIIIHTGRKNTRYGKIITLSAADSIDSIPLFRYGD